MPYTKNYDLDTDTTLGGDNASDYVAASQKATKTYIDNHSGGGGTVDQTYSSTSVNAQSGVAVAQAIASGKDVFIAEHGVTTYQEVLNAYNAEKEIFTTYIDAEYQATNILRLAAYNAAGGYFHFVSFSYNGAGYFHTYLYQSSGWNTIGIWTSERTENKVTSITSSSTNAQYPSAKSVLELLKTIYPVGCVYLTTNSTCPLSALFGTWSLVSHDKALWTGAGGDTGYTLSAGLPNITGTYDKTSGKVFLLNALTSEITRTGAFYTSSSQSDKYASATGSGTVVRGLGFDASRSNSIYGNSTTVQPPAYVVNVFRRTA